MFSHEEDLHELSLLLTMTFQYRSSQTCSQTRLCLLFLSFKGVSRKRIPNTANNELEAMSVRFVLGQFAKGVLQQVEKHADKYKSAFDFPIKSKQQMILSSRDATLNGFYIDPFWNFQRKSMDPFRNFRI